jgi:hypothetical protein
LLIESDDRRRVVFFSFSSPEKMNVPMQKIYIFLLLFLFYRSFVRSFVRSRPKREREEKGGKM